MTHWSGLYLQEDAARVEGAVTRGANEASSAVADGIRSVPTAADAVRGVGDGAVAALRGISQVRLLFQYNFRSLQSTVSKRTFTRPAVLLDKNTVVAWL